MSRRSSPPRSPKVPGSHESSCHDVKEEEEEEKPPAEKRISQIAEIQAQLEEELKRYSRLVSVAENMLAENSELLRGPPPGASLEKEESCHSSPNRPPTAPQSRSHSHRSDTMQEKNIMMSTTPPRPIYGSRSPSAPTSRHQTEMPSYSRRSADADETQYMEMRDDLDDSSFHERTGLPDLTSCSRKSDSSKRSTIPENLGTSITFSPEKTTRMREVTPEAFSHMSKSFSPENMSHMSRGFSPENVSCHTRNISPENASHPSKCMSRENTGYSSRGFSPEGASCHKRGFSPENVSHRSRGFSPENASCPSRGFSPENTSHRSRGFSPENASCPSRGMSPESATSKSKSACTSYDDSMQCLDVSSSMQHSCRTRSMSPHADTTEELEDEVQECCPNFSRYQQSNLGMICSPKSGVTQATSSNAYSVTFGGTRGSSAVNYLPSSSGTSRPNFEPGMAGGCLPGCRGNRAEDSPAHRFHSQVSNKTVDTKEKMESITLFSQNLSPGINYPKPQGFSGPKPMKLEKKPFPQQQKHHHEHHEMHHHPMPESMGNAPEFSDRALSALGHLSQLKKTPSYYRCGMNQGLDFFKTCCPKVKEATKSGGKIVKLPEVPCLSDEDLNELIKCEAQDVECTFILDSDERKLYKKPCPKQQKAQMTVKSLVQAHAAQVCAQPKYPPLDHPDPEDISPEVAAAMMFSQEQGVKLEGCPADTINHLFPEEPKWPFPEKSPRGSVSVVDPNQTDQEEIIEKIASVSSEGATDSAYTKTMKEKGEDLGPQRSYDVDFAIGQSKREYVLVAQKPQRINMIQFRGGNTPAWFPGYLSAFPDDEQGMKLVSSPSRLFHKAWTHTNPSNMPSSDIIVLD